MAAALVPLIAGLAPSIIDLITGLVHKHAPVAQANMGPQTGPVKFAQVFSDVRGDLGKAAAAGTIDKSLPPDEEIKLVIQSVVSSLKLQGLLGGASDTSVAPVASMPTPSLKAQQVTLKAGQSLTIVVA